jgi:hypothetical protein
VQNDFAEKYGSSLGQIEAQVEREYINYLNHQCLLEKQQKNHEMMTAKHRQDKIALSQLHAKKMPHCDKLQILRDG